MERVQSLNSEFWHWPLTYWPKINIYVLHGLWSIYVWSIIIVCQKVMDLLCGNDANFKVQIWPWPLIFYLKINRCLPSVMGNTYVNMVKYGTIIVIVRKPFFHRRTESHGETSILPLLRWRGIIRLHYRTNTPPPLLPANLWVMENNYVKYHPNPSCLWKIFEKHSFCLWC